MRRSPTSPSTAHRSGNFAPLAYRTADGGKTWQSIAGDLPADQPVKVVRERPEERRTSSTPAPSSRSS